MGAELIVIGATINTETLVSGEEKVAAIVNQYKDELEANFNSINYNESFDPDGSIEDFISSVTVGFMLLGDYDGGRFVSWWEIPNTKNMFIIFGGDSWGDDPIDGFSELCLAIEAAEVIPELGKALGVLGGGIVI